MENTRFVKLREEPRGLEAAAAWFHQKWGIAQEAYRASMEECLTGQGGVRGHRPAPGGLDQVDHPGV